MITVKSEFGQVTVGAITFVLALGTLSMVWPAILAIFYGVFLLLQPFGTEPEIARLSWTEVGNVPMVFASLRCPALLLS
jgi:hypothetical protein